MPAGGVLIAALSVAAALAPAQAATAATPTPTTGRLLVTMKAPAADHAQAAAATAIAASAGARATTLRVPQLRMVGLRARPGRSLHLLAERLRADPRVAHVRLERRFQLRYVPGDPAFTTLDRGADGPTSEWWATGLGLPSAWDSVRGDTAKVAIIDTGVDATHPDLSGRIVATADFDDTPNGQPATVDTVGHGTHVASLACAEPDNGIGLAGAGLGCGLLIAKSDLTEGSVARSLVWAADNGADAINMSFGTDGRVPAADVVVQALRYAHDRGAVLVAAAADEPVTEQGDPANVLQPVDTGPDQSRNFGLSVTAANGDNLRASFAGRGTEISLAAYGTYGPRGANGILGAFPAQTVDLERPSSFPMIPACRCRTTYQGDNRYAYLTGTSMASPMVAGIAALMRTANPDLPVEEVVRLLKQTAKRAGGWEPELGWGIIDAGAAIQAARAVDRTPPHSQLLKPKLTGRTILLRWRGADDPAPGVSASGIARFELWRSAAGRPARKVATTRGRMLRTRGMRGQNYSFFTIAVDYAGNREAPPTVADARVRVKR